MKTKFIVILILFSMALPTQAFRLNKGKIFSLSFHTGYGHSAKEENGLTKTTGNYVNSMRPGFIWGGEFDIQPLQIFGLGVLYSYYGSKGTHEDGSDHIRVKYIAPQIFFKLIQTDIWNLKAGFGLGSIKYTNDSKVFSKERKVWGKDFGFNYGVTLEYKLLSNLGVHLQISYIGGGSGSVSIDYHDEEIILTPSSSTYPSIDFSHFDIGLGTTLHF